MSAYYNPAEDGILAGKAENRSMEMADERKLFPLRMTEEEHARIQKAAAGSRQSMNEWIMRAIDNRLEYESRPDVIHAREEYNRR